MEDKELYKQKLQAQLDEWKADIAKLRAKAAGAKADAQITLNKQIEDIESRLQAATSKFSELSDASEEAWDTVKKGVESAWDSLKTSVSDAASKLKK